MDPSRVSPPSLASSGEQPCTATNFSGIPNPSAHFSVDFYLMLVLVDSFVGGPSADVHILTLPKEILLVRTNLPSEQNILTEPLLQGLCLCRLRCPAGC